MIRLLMVAAAVVAVIACCGCGAAADEVNVTFEGHFGGATHAAEPSGNTGYVGQGQDFVVLDIRQLTNNNLPATSFTY